MKALIVNQYYEPDLASTGRYIAGLTEGLVRSGEHEVTVVAGQPSYSEQSPAPLARSVRKGGRRVIRVPVVPTGRSNLFSRFAGYLSFMAGATLIALREAQRGGFDVVITFHNPPTVGFIGYIIARLFDVPFVYCLFDILPDVVEVGEWRLPRWVRRLWRRFNRALYGRACRIVVLSRAMAEVLQERGVPRRKVSVLPLWARPEFSELTPSDRDLDAATYSDARPLRVLYNGNIGYMHWTSPLVEAASALAGCAIEFRVVGEGPERPAMRRAATEAELSNMWFVDYLPIDAYAAELGRADVAVVALKAGAQRICFPSRTLTFLAAGIPVVALMDRTGGTARLVAETDAGWVVEGPDDLIRVLARLLSDPAEVAAKARNAQAVYFDQFGNEKSVATFRGILNSCVARS